ncbi:MAG: hypothetical protein WC314_25435 [Vulcanimicrobiota bacterium]
MQSRREFLKLLGLAVGASFTGCGSSGGDSFVRNGGQAPLAYRFVPLVNAGAVLPRSSSIIAQASDDAAPFLGGVMINDLRHVCFHANDQAQRKGVFEVDYDADGNTAPIKHLLQEGDVLADGTVVDDISGGYLNNEDEAVFVVNDSDGVASMQVSRGLDSFETFFGEYDTVSDGGQLDGELQPEVGLADNGDLLFVCCGKNEEGVEIGESLYYLPKDTASETTRLLSENDLIPGSNCAFRSFGLAEIGNDGSYLVQGCAAPLEADLTSETSSGLTYLAMGQVGEEPEILVADPTLGISGAIQGTVCMGARMSEIGCGFICQTDSDHTQLYLDKRKLLEASIDGTGSLSPRNQPIVSFFPPVFGPNGMMLVQVFTATGTEILAYDGQSFSTVLARGDFIGGKQVEMILFGCLPHAINVHGEFVAVVEFTNGESAVVVGMPV